MNESTLHTFADIFFRMIILAGMIVALGALFQWSVFAGILYIVAQVYVGYQMDLDERKGRS